MKVSVLTTDTPHHAYFVKRVSECGVRLQVVEELRHLSPPFDVAHGFEVRRDDYEYDLWFAGRRSGLGDYADIRRVDSINDPETAAMIREYKPDLVIVFGTSRLAEAVIAAADTVLNLHGGDPEQYRGMDSHLWAIYHRDFDNLLTCLHVVNRDLDDGAIVSIRPVALARGMKLHQLRASNTETAWRLSHDAIREFAETGRVMSRPQRMRGRYYSFMPSVLKAQCERRFDAYCENLP